MGILDAPALSPKSGLAQIARGDSDIAVRALRSDLDCGYSTAFGWQGDSTGDSYGETTDNNPGERTPVKLAKLIGAAYPDYHVLARRFNPANSAVTTLQTKAAGREYTRTAGRTVRWQPSNAADPFASGVLDMRILVAPDTWATSGEQALIASTRRDVAGTFSDFLRFSWNIFTNGDMYLRWSTNGTSWTHGAYSATIPGRTNGQPIWLRATLEIVAGSSGTTRVSYYWSADGAAWTGIGSPVSTSGVTAAMAYDANSFFEMGGSGWNGVGNTMTGKIYEVQLRDGLDGTLRGPCLPRLWERYGTTGVTYGGAPTLYLANSSWSGSTLAHHMDTANFGKMTPDYGQMVTFFNMSHNQGGASGQTQWVKPYEAWVDAVSARQPNTTPVAVLQNPHSSAWVNEASFGISHQLRLREIAALAGRRRWGVLDLFRSMSKDSRGIAALLLADGLHPNSDGYDVAAKTGAKLLGIAA